MADDPTAPTRDIETIPTHPEEMKAVFNVTIGNSLSMQSSARMTPAGLIALGIAISAVLLATAAIVRASRRGT